MNFKLCNQFSAYFIVICLFAGCSTQHHRESVDRAAYEAIQEYQRANLGESEPFTVEKPSIELRQRIMQSQPIQFSHPASINVNHLEPIEHWPSDGYITPATVSEILTAATSPISLNLVDALQIAAKNSREYQGQKEQVFQEALNLDLQEEQFRASFFNGIDAQYENDRTDTDSPDGIVTENFGAGFNPSISKTFLSGAQLSAQLGWDLAMLLSPGSVSSKSLFGDASITVPLLRGAGRHIVAEPLTQAQRNMVYAIYEFERFKRSFAVSIADEYLSVLQRIDEVKNAEQNYKSLITSARRAQMNLRTGKISPVEVDQAYQNELSARNRWVSSRQAYANAIDSFKYELGLPIDASIELNRDEFVRLAQSSETIIAGATSLQRDEEVPPADAPIVLQEPTSRNAGKMEIEPIEAIRLAFENRLDLRTVQGRVYDAQRKVVVAADGLRPEITLFGSVSTGQSRGIGSADRADSQVLDLGRGLYSALLTVDLPTERTREAIEFRRSYIDLERSVRDLQELEGRIKLDIRNQLRILVDARESLRIQVLSVNLAEQRVQSTELFMEAGRIEIRDLLDAQEDLLSAQNALTSAMVNYRITELELQRDLGVLKVNHEGIWQEYNPEMNSNESS
ncbi:MAG: TolC family protein [Candidatus Hinthialibacter antarcticus]|nr:TolC family protein [Candidatus Hinthialibacter antarcticus]